MGCVYKVRHTVLEQEHAMKILYGDLGKDLLGDVYASASFRGSMAPVYVARAIAAAAERARA